MMFPIRRINPKVSITQLKMTVQKISCVMYVHPQMYSFAPNHNLPNLKSLASQWKETPTLWGEN